MISKQERERKKKSFDEERHNRYAWDEIPGSWTQRQKTAYEIRGRLLDAATRLYPAFAQAENFEREIKAVEVDRDFLLACETTLTTEMRLMGDPQGGYALGRFTNLRLSIDHIHGQFNPDMGYGLSTLELGKLFLVAGRGAHYPGEQFPRISWPGSLPLLEDKLKNLRAKLEHAIDLCNQFEQIPVQEPVTS